MRKIIKKYKKTVMSLVLAVAMLVSSSIAVLAKEVDTKATSYTTVTEIYDWGAAITNVIVDLGQPVQQGSLNKDNFSVFVSRSDDRVETPLLDEGYRTITKAYVSDEKGNLVENGKYAVLEMEVGPNVSLGSPLNYYDGANVWIHCDYRITQTKDIISGSTKISGLVANIDLGGTRKVVDDFKIGEGKYDSIKLTYAEYVPVKDDKKNPLIIWLHGGGEGGTDATIPISANKTVNLSEKEI